MKTNGFKKILLTAAAVALTAVAVFTAGCSSDGVKRYKSTAQELKTAAVVGEFEAPYELVRYFVANSRSDAEAKAALTGEDVAALTEAYAIGMLQNFYAPLTLWEKEGHELKSDELDEIVDLTIEYYMENYYANEAKNYLADLKANHMNDSVFRTVIGQQTISEQLYNYYLDYGVIADDEETIRAALRGEDFIRVKQVLICNDEGDDPATNLALAEKVQKLAASGEDFDALIEEYGEDYSMYRNPDGYYITKNEMLEEFEVAAFALEIGEISGVVDVGVGYSIILRLEKDEAYLDANYDTLAENYRASMYYDLLAEQAEQLTVEKKENFDVAAILAAIEQE